jgi:hypothetical protein
VTLTANSDGVGGGGVTVGGAIFTNGGSFQATGRDLIALNAPVNTVRPLPGSGAGRRYPQLDQWPRSGRRSRDRRVLLGNCERRRVDAGRLRFEHWHEASPGRDGISVGAGVQLNTGTGSFSATVTDPGSAGSFNTAAGSQITTNGATLTSDNMEIQGLLNAGAGTVTFRQNTVARNVDLGTNTPGKLSLTQDRIQ